MKRRVETILRLLAEADGYTTIEHIAQETDAGVRTIHRDLEMLERGLGLRGVRLERRRGYGVRLIDPLPVDVFESGLGGPAHGTIESNERPLMVLVYLISSGDWIKVSELAHAFFVSDSSVRSDLDGLEDLIPEQVTLERQKGVGVRISGDEATLRLLFLSVYPALFPFYALREFDAGEARESGGRRSDGYRRIVQSMHLLEQYTEFVAALGESQAQLGFSVAPAYVSLLYGYLYLLRRRRDAGALLQSAPRWSLGVPDPYVETAGGIAAALGISQPLETEFLARVLAACEVAAPPAERVPDLLGDLAPVVQGIIERTLGVLEEKERTWLHDDRALLDYLRMTIAAAARRMDLGIPHWRAFVAHPYPALEESPEAAALSAEFLLDMTHLVTGLSPAIVRRELGEAALAIGARIETIHRRRAAHVSVKILCYEGLGMSSYLRALVREVLPPGARIDSRWDPDFASSTEAFAYDLVISTYPLHLDGVAVLMIDADMSPDAIRTELRRSVMEAVQDSGAAIDESDPAPAPSDDGQSISLPAIMAVVNGFFVVRRDPQLSLVDQAVAALNRGDCDPEVIRHDFLRREAYGSLVFEELNIRLVHCRTQGVPEPRAGVIQTGGAEPAVLVLAAPVSAPSTDTRVLSEMVVALTDIPDFPRVLSEEDRETVQAALLALFSRIIG